MARQPDETDGGNAVDRVVQRVAVGLSRRSFLGKLGKLGLGAGLGLAGVGSALAAFCENEREDLICYNCGTCTDRNGNSGAKNTYRTRTCCTQVNGSFSCTSWTNRYSCKLC